jgi:hypothetical protein
MPQKYNSEFISRVLEADPKPLDALITTLTMMEPGDEFQGNVGKITKLRGGTFKLEVTREVISSGIDEIFNGVFGADPIDKMFNGEK